MSCGIKRKSLIDYFILLNTNPSLATVLGHLHPSYKYRTYLSEIHRNDVPTFLLVFTVTSSLIKIMCIFNFPIQATCPTHLLELNYTNNAMLPG